MAHRPEWWAEAAGSRSLLDMALEVHMDNTGAAALDSDERVTCLRCIREAVENWRTDSHDRDFDAAVLELLRVTLSESEVEDSVRHPLA